LDAVERMEGSESTGLPAPMDLRQATMASTTASVRRLRARMSALEDE